MGGKAGAGGKERPRFGQEKEDGAVGERRKRKKKKQEDNWRKRRAWKRKRRGQSRKREVERGG